MLKYVLRLNFDEEPKYDYIINCLKQYYEQIKETSMPSIEWIVRKVPLLL